MIEDSSAVSVTSLSRNINGKSVLDGISFAVFKGEVFGIIGPNGAGKTTTLRILSGIIIKYRGEVSIFGEKPTTARRKGYISYMPEDAFPYDRLTGIENLEFYAKIYSNGNKDLEREYLERGVKIASLQDRIYDKVAEYSRGMKRRLIIARTLMVNPKLAILDEPTSALDVESSVRIREVIRSMKGNTTLILSSHNLLEVEYMCDRVLMINNGRAIRLGKPKDIIQETGTQNLEESFIKLVGETQRSTIS
ncbi:ABC transporter ATP-binding protein [Metallosphaera hakonensis]|uniref:Multidrug ABC transporter ATP-binding protein n=1 Tax=Metallosphaera hakonensis JCM 8857 = DSM 7519 TaxID=1293036 RepID=A0A2U9IS01_9CREN|nr:ABC transporter ATP-binding protein [Metallosphaera hakonensis]AWR98796.1 ATP-binding cassette domain-containing protein [Metallosphaera hakonensis JCM 8857 = DSM 7519]